MAAGLHWLHTHRIVHFDLKVLSADKSTCCCSELYLLLCCPAVPLVTGQSACNASSCRLKCFCLLLNAKQLWLGSTNRASAWRRRGGKARVALQSTQQTPSSSRLTVCLAGSCRARTSCWRGMAQQRSQTWGSPAS